MLHAALRCLSPNHWLQGCCLRHHLMPHAALRCLSPKHWLQAPETNVLTVLVAGLTTGLRSWLTPRALSPNPGSQPGSPSGSSKPKGEPLPVSNPSRLAASLVDKPRSILFVIPAPRYIQPLLFLRATRETKTLLCTHRACSADSCLGLAWETLS